MLASLCPSTAPDKHNAFISHELFNTTFKDCENFNVIAAKKRESAWHQPLTLPLWIWNSQPASRALTAPWLPLAILGKLTFPFRPLILHLLNEHSRIALTSQGGKKSKKNLSVHYSVHREGWATASEQIES